jgi:homoserine kinase type II
MEKPDPIDEGALARRLSGLFGVSAVSAVDQVSGGVRSRNFAVTTPEGKFFLKQYRNRVSSAVIEIARSQKFFAAHGIPVILPVEDRYGRPAFWFDGCWNYLFPFVDGRSPSSAGLDGPTIDSLARTLARMHRAGAAYGDRPFQSLRLWDPEMFKLERVEIEEALLTKPSRTPLEDLVLELIRAKTRLVEKNRLRPGDVRLPFDTLLHGDFIYQNVFVDAAGGVTHVYDFEKTAVGPRAYELARSIVVSCFDDGWDERQFAHARRFLAAYQAEFPITREEFSQAVETYRTHIVHMTWIEASLVLHGSERYKQIIPSHARRIEELMKGTGPFVDRVWP